jgi:dihydrofolate reductase
MSILLYAVTENNYFCQKQEAQKTDKDWMKIPLDRKLFKFITTLFKETIILSGRKTYNILPSSMFSDRKIIALRKKNLQLQAALIKYPNSIIIGGHEILTYFNQPDYLQKVHTILTVKLPIIIESAQETNYKKDPLLNLKSKKSADHSFTITNNTHTIILESWKF